MTRSLFVSTLLCLCAANMVSAQTTPIDRPVEEVPFVVTPPRIVERMLQMAEVGASDTVYDLGSGDGRIVLAAAKRGAKSFGVEIDPALVKQSEAAASAAKLQARAKFAVQDIFETDLRRASVVTMYLLPDFNLKLRPILFSQLAPGARVVSHEWDMGDWAPDETLHVRSPEKPLGNTFVHKVFLWVIPAKLEGRWRVQVQGVAEPVEFTVTQNYQVLSVAPSRGFVRVASLRGRSVIFTWSDGERTHRLVGEVSGAGDKLSGRAGTLNEEVGKRTWSAQKIQ